VYVDNENEWDAALSAFAAHSAITGRWHGDLHALEPDPKHVSTSYVERQT
jgi:hypothetical protein